VTLWRTFTPSESSNDVGLVSAVVVVVSGDTFGISNATLGVSVGDSGDFLGEVSTRFGRTDPGIKAPTLILRLCFNFPGLLFVLLKIPKYLCKYQTDRTSCYVSSLVSRDGGSSLNKLALLEVVSSKSFTKSSRSDKLSDFVSHSSSGGGDESNSLILDARASIFSDEANKSVFGEFSNRLLLDSKMSLGTSSDLEVL
jgi:hypothetical protein